MTHWVKKGTYFSTALSPCLTVMLSINNESPLFAGCPAGTSNNNVSPRTTSHLPGTAKKRPPNPIFFFVVWFGWTQCATSTENLKGGILHSSGRFVWPQRQRQRHKKIARHRHRQEAVGWTQIFPALINRRCRHVAPWARRKREEEEKTRKEK